MQPWSHHLFFLSLCIFTPICSYIPELLVYALVYITELRAHSVHSVHLSHDLSSWHISLVVLVFFVEGITLVLKYGCLV